MPESGSSLRNTPGEWLLAALLATNLAWTTLHLGGVRPETMVVSWALTGLTLALQLALAAWTEERPHPASVWFLPFLIYAAGNVLFVSPVGWLGKRDWLGWAQLIAIYWVSLNGLRRTGPRALVFGTAVTLAGAAVMFAAYQRFIAPDWLTMGRTQVDQYLGRSSGCFGNPNSLGAFMVVFIPPLLALTWQRGASAVQRILCGYLAGIMLLGLGLSISRGSLLALVAALACWPLFARTQNWASRILWAATALGAALMAGVVLYSMAPRVKARFDALASDRGERSRPVLWHAAGEMFAAAPVFGTGGGSFNTLFERHRPERFNDEPQWTHNEYLNTLSDYGAAGFLLFFGAIAAIGWRLIQDQAPGAAAEVNTGWAAPDVTHAMAVGLFAFALACGVDFHLKIPALALTAALMAGEVVRRLWPEGLAAPATLGRQVGLGIAAVVVAILTLALAIPTFQAEAARYPARQKIDVMALNPNPSLNLQKSTLSEARAGFAEALAYDGSNAQAWADAAYVAALWSRVAPLRANELGREAETAARNALALSDAVPEFWIRLGVGLDMQGRWQEGSDAFIRALKLAPANPLIWYHQAYHLSLNPRAKALALAAVETCLRLDPNYASAKALRQRLTSPD